MMPKNSSLMVRLDEESKALLASAAELRKVSVSDYVRSIVVSQARRELAAAEAQVISMTSEEQLEFWEALSKPPKLTKAQKQLGKLMRGDASAVLGFPKPGRLSRSINHIHVENSSQETTTLMSG